MKKIILASIIIVSSITLAYIIQMANENSNIKYSDTVQNNIESDIPTNVKTYDSLFRVAAYPDDYIGKSQTGASGYSKYVLTPIEGNMQLYNSLSSKNTNQTTVVVIPIFTLLAYAHNSFYDYYAGNCGKECLTINAITVFPTLKFDYRSSANAKQVFEILGYDTITDADIDKDPSILTKYDKIILLHSEYVTKKMFDAITKHPKVIYLYPNSLYAEISADEETSSIKLIRGHGYPDKNIANGFNWKFDNTNPYEFDKECNKWEFYKIDNGFMLNCYPDQIIFSDERLLQTIRDL
jgi:hypothetical protein